MYLRRQFFERIAQTSEIPQAFEIDHALGSFLYSKNGEPYLDFVSGFSVSNLGHSHPEIVHAIQVQSEKYLHSNVYGEHIQTPQVELANLLSQLLPGELNAVYFLNSGSEAVDAAIKLCRKYNSRSDIVASKNAYHGSTLGAESLRSDEAHSRPFRPLIPNIKFIRPNYIEDLELIDQNTSLVITEVVQAEAGVFVLDPDYLRSLRKKCSDENVLLVFDEIQTGMCRTGKLFAFQNYGITPDVLICGKALGGGLPLSAVISSKKLLLEFSQKPALGHLTTFGGHPLSCAAGLQSLKIILKNNTEQEVFRKSNLIREYFTHPKIKSIRFSGLLIALELENEKLVMQFIRLAYQRKILVESFLFCPHAVRIAPPLNTTDEILHKACKELCEILEVI